MKTGGIIGIYLAAGNSKRFGENKLMSQIGKHPLGSFALKTALESDLDKLVVVTQESDQLNWVCPTLFHHYKQKWFHIPCAESIHGQANSLKCGLHFAIKHHAEAVLVILADQPFISVKMINKILLKYRQNKPERSFIASRRSGVICPPILFRHNVFHELNKLQGDKGARFFIRNRMDEGGFVEFTNSMLFFDVDTEEDYLSLLEKIKLK